MTKPIVAIGEAMVEMSGGDGGAYRLGFAGDTMNTAYYLRQLMPADQPVDYFTALGDDIYSARMRQFLDEAGLGTSHIREIPGKRPGLYLIHQADGDRHFTYWRDTSAARHLADDRGALEGALADASLIYFSGITLAILAPAARGTLFSVLEHQRSAGSKIAFDPNIRPALWSGKSEIVDALTQAASLCDTVLPTHADEVPFFGDADDGATAQRYLDAGCTEVVVKNGAGPALVATRDGQWRVATQPVDTVVDATGAGDSFNAGYLAARASGASPEDAVHAGHRTAAIVIGHHGAIIPKSAFG